MYSNTVRLKSNYSKIKHKLLSLAFNLGVFRTGRSLWANSLTVLNYHRIDDVTRTGFDSFKPNVSASPAEFDRQMHYISRWFTVINIKRLVNWLNGKEDLPRYAALITFDDGYLDNYVHAFPVLKKYNLGAVIYLTTGYIGTDQPFFWDLAAYCFFHTLHTSITFPDGIVRTWQNPMERDQILISWIEALKIKAETEKKAIIEHLPKQLNVSIPKGYFRNLMMNWEQVRELQTHGIEFGGHTITHPILSRVSLDTAISEIEGSKLQLEKMLEQPVLSFAYTNGMEKDFNPVIENITEKAGYKAAFSLLNGPSMQREVRDNPFAIRRIFISNRHTLPAFGALLSPLNRYRP